MAVIFSVLTTMMFYAAAIPDVILGASSVPEAANAGRTVASHAIGVLVAVLGAGGLGWSLRPLVTTALARTRVR